MAIRTKANFSGTYLTTVGTWPDNTTGDISPADLRAGMQDYLDSQGSFWPLDTSGIIGSDSSTGITGADFASGITAQLWKEGRVFYDSENHTFAVYNDKPDVTLQLGQETHVRAVNKTGATIPNGTPVATTGAQGNRPTIEPAFAGSGYVYAHNVIGLTTHDALDNEEVLVTVNGTIGADTSLLGEGSGIFLSPTVSGGITLIQPSAPNHTIHLGYSLNKTNSGKVLVHINREAHITDASDVNGTTPEDGYILKYNGASGYWDPSDDLNPTGVVARKFMIASWTADTITARPKNIFGTVYSEAAFTGSIISSVSLPTITQGYNRHGIINVTAVGTSGTINIIGNKINENTGVITSGYIDAIDVTGTGYYQGPSKFIDQITFSGTAPASVTATAYTATYADFGNSHIGLKYVRFGWIPSNPSWDVALRVKKINNDGSITDLDQNRLAFNSGEDANRAANGIVGHAKVIQDDQVEIRGDQNEGIVIELTNKDNDSLPANIGSADFYIGFYKYNA